jgi:hypothetical protein
LTGQLLRRRNDRRPIWASGPVTVFPFKA